MPPERQRLITFEGSEGCGKSTQIELTRAWLTEKGCPVTLCREPGGTPLGESIRHLLKHDEAGHAMHPVSELLLFAASRAELVRKVIAPALDQGQWVLCDRFHDSTTIYQGVARELGPETTGPVNALAIGPFLPGLTLVLDLDPALAIERARTRTQGTHDRMEAEPASFYHRVRQGYLDLAAREPDRVRVIHADRPTGDVLASIQQEMTHAFPSLLD